MRRVLLPRLRQTGRKTQRVDKGHPLGMHKACTKTDQGRGGGGVSLFEHTLGGVQRAKMADL